MEMGCFCRILSGGEWILHCFIVDFFLLENEIGIAFMIIFFLWTELSLHFLLIFFCWKKKKNQCWFHIGFFPADILNQPSFCGEFSAHKWNQNSFLYLFFSAGEWNCANRINIAWIENFSAGEGSQNRFCSHFFF